MGGPARPEKVRVRAENKWPEFIGTDLGLTFSTWPGPEKSLFMICTLNLFYIMYNMYNCICLFQLFVICVLNYVQYVTIVFVYFNYL